MLLLTKGKQDRIIVTLTEKCTLSNPYFLFVFRYAGAGEAVKVVMADQSNFKERYNEFILNTDAYFLSEPDGFYTYEVYEQTDSENIDESLLNNVERGIMKLVSTPNSVQAYAGETTQFTIYHAQ